MGIIREVDNKKGYNFITELSNLLEKYNASILLERVFDNEYDSHAELDFMVDDLMIGDTISAGFNKKIDSNDIKLLIE